jgi:hypothetical protein
VATFNYQPNRYESEARVYASDFLRQDLATEFKLLACTNFSTNRAFMWAFEAAHLLCSGSEGNAPAVKLLKMAIKEIEDDDAK